MNFVRLNQSITRSFRFILAVAMLFMLMFSTPALALGNSKSAPEDGTTQLNQIQKETDDLARSAPPTLKETQAKTQKGINEVQGDADKDKMKRPENSKNSNTVKDEVESLLHNATQGK
jgi:hypothetical protein